MSDPIGNIMERTMRIFRLFERACYYLYPQQKRFGFGLGNLKTIFIRNNGLMAAIRLPKEIVRINSEIIVGGKSLRKLRLFYFLKGD